MIVIELWPMNVASAFAFTPAGDHRGRVGVPESLAPAGRGVAETQLQVDGRDRRGDVAGAANNSNHALQINADAIAFAVLTHAYSTESVNGIPGARVPGNFQIPAPAEPEGTVGSDGGDADHDGA